MKITLVRPPYVIPKNSVYGNKGVPPIGLVYVATKLQSSGFQVVCIDSFAEGMDHFAQIDDTDFYYNGLSTSEIVARIPKDTAVIGLSCMFSNEWINTKKLILNIKSAFPQAQLVLGGEHATADYEYILTHFPEVDYCVLGEGEEKMLSLMNALKDNLTVSDNTAHVAYYDSSLKKVIVSKGEYRIKNLSTFPNPDWSLIPIRNYLDKGYGFSMLGKRSIPMIFSRGCPYRCTFCSNESMWTAKWTPRPVEDVIYEIKKNVDLYKIEHIDVFDLTAIVNRNWTLEFCRQLKNENLNLTWALPSGTRSEALDHQVLTELFESGCRKITYAPESGSENMSQKIQKKVNLNRMLKSMKVAVKVGFVVKANIIFGFPDEKISDVIKNFVFIAKMAWIGIHDVPCFGFTPYPGSRLFDQLLKSKKINRDDNYDLYLAKLVYTSPLDRKSWSEHLPHFIMPFLSLGGMSFFYFFQYCFRPWRFLLLIKRISFNTPVTMLEAALRNIYESRLRKTRTSSI